MTSTPALGTLIASYGAESVTASYAAAYPFALLSIIILLRIIAMC